jgi:hypothetical protein
MYLMQHGHVTNNTKKNNYTCGIMSCCKKKQNEMHFFIHFTKFSGNSRCILVMLSSCDEN